MKDLKEIGKLLENTRKEKGYTIEEVNKRTRIQPNVLKSLENGTVGDSLNKVYVRAFVKKYTDFLGLNTADILKGYTRGAGQESEQKLYIRPEEESGIDITQYSPTVVRLVIAGVVVILIFTGLFKIKHSIRKRPSRISRTAIQAKVVPQKIAHSKPIHKKTFKKTPIQKKDEQIKTIEKKDVAKVTAEVQLSLRVVDDVWLRVEKDGNIVFKGILRRGSDELWTADKDLNLRVGKLEAIRFTVNGKDLGKMGSGVENIVVNKNGIKIGRKFHPTS